MQIEFPVRGERHRLSPAVRANLPGDFISLPDGVTHFECAGPEKAPILVLIHGFSVPYFIWDPTFDALTTAGFRVLRYDLFGRGYSDRPLKSNSVELFDRQLVDLLDMLSIEQVDAVIGLSMGGVIAASFASLHPERIKRLGLIDPAGFALDYPLYIRSLMLPVIGEIAVSLIGKKVFRRLAGKDFYDPKHIDAFIEKFQQQMQFKGFRRSLLSTLRSGILSSGAEIYKLVGETDIPVLLIWGEQDFTTPFEDSAKLTELIPQAEFYPIADSGHIPHHEHSSQVNPIVLEFLKA